MQTYLRPEHVKTAYGPWFDGRYILRLWRRWFFVAVCMALTAGIAVFIVTDQLLPNKYTASALTSVVPKTNSSGSLTGSAIEGAIRRNESMWNSNVLKKEIFGSKSEKETEGSFSAERIASGILQISGNSETAQEAYYILNAAINSYKPLAPNFDSEYNTVILTRVTEEAISVARKRPILYAAIAFAGVIALIYAVLLFWSMFTLVLHNETQTRQLLSEPLYEAVPIVRKKKKKKLLVGQPGVPYSFQERIDHLASRVVQHLHRYEQKVVMVTSVTANEGKSTISSNLAVALARRGKSVLLMDLDLRKPSLCRQFGREEGGTEELFSVISQNKPLARYAESWEKNPSLHILWQFHAVKDSDQRIEESEMKALLEEAKEEFDYIILDTPPMAPVRDSKVIAGAADCSLLIVRQDLAHAAAANAVMDHLEECGAPCAGAVLNRCHNLATIKKSSHGKNEYYYGYGKRSEGKA